MTQTKQINKKQRHTPLPCLERPPNVLLEAPPQRCDHEQRHEQVAKPGVVADGVERRVERVPEPAPHSGEEVEEREGHVDQHSHDAEKERPG